MKSVAIFFFLSTEKVKNIINATARFGLKMKNPCWARVSIMVSDPARIQTWNLLIRSQILYSVELRGHRFVGCKYRRKSKKNRLEIIGKTWLPFSPKWT